MAQVKALVKDGDILLLALNPDGMVPVASDPANEYTVAQAFKVVADRATTTLALVPLGPTKNVPTPRVQQIFVG